MAYSNACSSILHHCSKHKIPVRSEPLGTEAYSSASLSCANMQQAGNPGQDRSPSLAYQSTPLSCSNAVSTTSSSFSSVSLAYSNAHPSYCTHCSKHKSRSDRSLAGILECFTILRHRSKHHISVIFKPCAGKLQYMPISTPP